MGRLPPQTNALDSFARSLGSSSWQRDPRRGAAGRIPRGNAPCLPSSYRGRPPIRSKRTCAFRAGGARVRVDT